MGNAGMLYSMLPLSGGSQRAARESVQPDFILALVISNDGACVFRVHYGHAVCAPCVWRHPGPYLVLPQQYLLLASMSLRERCLSTI